MSKILNALITASLVMLLSLSMAACGNDEKEKTSTAKPASQQVDQPTRPSEQMAPASDLPATEPPRMTATETPKTDITRATSPSPASLPPDGKQAQLLALAKKSGCLACHSIDKKVVGPAWKDVGNRYRGKADAREQLVEKISKGGKGNWTDITGGVPMPPYFPRVTRENIEKLVDFILS